MPIKEKAMLMLDELDEGQLEFIVTILDYLKRNTIPVSSDTPNEETIAAINEARNMKADEMPTFSGSTSDFIRMMLED